jgi:dTDP-4-amino-4,6-dideoxygalactose transaminase
MVGTIGDVGCFSFFANKNMTTGEGGMVVTRDDQLAEKIRIRRSHGMTTLTWERHKGHSFSYDVVARGYNYRLDEMRAALGIVQLNRLEEKNARRRALTQKYWDNLRDMEQIQLPFNLGPKGSSYHIFPVVLKNKELRAPFMAALAQSGIQTSIHYPPVHKFSYTGLFWPRGFDYQLPITDAVASREITLPLFPTMSHEQFQTIIAAIRDFSR